MPRINKITVRRGEGPPPNDVLDTAELAFDTKAKKLYVGASDGKAVKVGGDSIWMGPQPPEDKDIKYWIDTSSDGSIDTEKALIVDTVYPVGSIYMSVSATNPQLLFGGTWEQLENTFLLGAGSSYEAGTTGGSADSIVVSHTHTFTGSEVTSKGQSQTHSHTFTGTAVTSGGSSASSTGTQSANHYHSYPNPLLMWNTAASTANVALSAAGRNQAGWRGTDVLGKTTTGNNSANHSHSMAHTHSVTAKGTNGNASADHTHKVTASGTNSSTGSSGTGANMPPYLVVYMWKRVS